MKYVVAVCGLMLLAGCSPAEAPAHFICNGTGVAADTPGQVEELLGWTLAVQHDQRGDFWGNAVLQIPGVSISERFNYVTEAGQILLLGQNAHSTAGRFNRVTGQLELNWPGGQVSMACASADPLV